MSKPTAKRLHAKRLARQRKPRRQRAEEGWPICAMAPAAVLPLIATMHSVTGRAPPTLQPTIRATSNTRN